MFSEPRNVYFLKGIEQENKKENKKDMDRHTMR